MTMEEDSAGLTPYRSMIALEPKPKKLHGLIPSKVIYPDNHNCSKPTLNRFFRWLLFWLPDLKWGSVYRCRKCDQVFVADWEYPSMWQDGWSWQSLRWREDRIDKWIKAGGDEK
jgi:hypothetical protein